MTLVFNTGCPIDSQSQGLEASLLNKCSCLARALGVTKFIIVKGHTLLCYLSQT
jgi:hypothetical protein